MNKFNNNSRSKYYILFCLSLLLITSSAQLQNNDESKHEEQKVGSTIATQESIVDQLVVHRALQGCSATDFIGTTIVQKSSDNFCYKLEMFENGVFGRDPESLNDCSKVNFTPSQEFSIFDYIDGNRIYYKAGALGMTGYFDIVKDDNASDMSLQVQKFDMTTKEFIVIFTFPSCVAPTHTPTVEPTDLPSGKPSALPSLRPSDEPSISQEPSVLPSASAKPSVVPSDEPSASPKPSALPSQVPSDLPTTEPSLSLKPSSVPSNYPSAMPSSQPSEEPSTSPSKAPSTTPSEVPSGEPTLDLRCNAGEFIGRTIIQSDQNQNCYKLQLFPDGIFGMDPASSNNDCTSEDFTPSLQFSIYDYHTDNKIYFKAGSLGMVGRFDIKIDNTLTDYRIQVNQWDETNKQFVVVIWFPSCTAPSASPSDQPSISMKPSLKPTSYPSEEPSASVKPTLLPTTIPSTSPSQEPVTACKAKDKIGRTVVQKVGNECVKVEMFVGGVFGLASGTAGNDCTNGNFTPSMVLGTFSKAVDNKIYYDGNGGETGDMYGYFEYIEDKHVSGEQFDIVDFNMTAKTFNVRVTTPTCQIPAISFAVGYEHSCLLRHHQSFTCWGNNQYGQLGDGSNVSTNSTVAVQGIDIDNVFQVVAGYHHTCVVTFERTMLCWGWNNHGQVGDGSFTSRSSPVTVIDDPIIARQGTAGGFHTCALVQGKSVFCWGNNKYGQIGDGSTTSRNTPVKVDALGENVVQVSAGYTHTCALLTDGTIKCWGQNNHNQLGIACSLKQCINPVPVPQVENAVSVTAGVSHTCAVLIDGSVKCWGENHHNQLGTGASASRIRPSPVNKIKNVARLETGNFHSCALLTNDSVKCWGSNTLGQLGDGSLKSWLSPVGASILERSVSHIASSSVAYRSYAMLEDGTIKCWGSNDSNKCSVAHLM